MPAVRAMDFVVCSKCHLAWRAGRSAAMHIASCEGDQPDGGSQKFYNLNTKRKGWGLPPLEAGQPGDDRQRFATVRTNGEAGNGSPAAAPMPAATGGAGGAATLSPQLADALFTCPECGCNIRERLGQIITAGSLTIRPLAAASA